ncbi:MAG TPA: glycosyl hydrolase family 79 C-terminal domain-containing protein [Solirubrobacteraceae bacterium]|nr:glycosyl hydrolase family 79 C-terminal domain-containing protein [Solirubrobacteraceae bacterium]
MLPRLRSLRPLLVLAVLLLVPTPAAAATMTLTIGGAGRQQASRVIPPGFLGLSFEYWAIPAYAGSDPSAVDPVFVRLVRNLTDGSPPVLRIGGDTTDETWWPAAGVVPPAGATFALTPRWIAVTRALADELQARLILGINLEADDAGTAGAEANALVDGIGRQRVEALELGNEPELYGKFDWGASGMPGRPNGYDFADFDGDFSRIAKALPSVPLAGPAIGAEDWFGNLGPFLSDQPRVAVATLHRYPLELCGSTTGEARYPTIAHLLAPSASRSLADSVAADVRTAHADHVPLRIDEMNSVSCGDGQFPGVTRSFASALWALDALFQMARVGVDGVNIHSYPGATYSLFSFHRSDGRWRATVAPDYYGLDLFAQAAPPGSRLLTVVPNGGRRFDVWAVRAPDHTIRVVVINTGSRTRTVAARAPTAASGTGRATLERLEAPGLSARGGVTLGGQSFGPVTATGVLAGPRQTAVVARSRDGYVFRVPGESAAMLTIAPS